MDNDKLKLAAIILAAFTAGEMHMRRKAIKNLTRNLPKRDRMKYLDGFSDGWRTALADRPSVLLAHARLTRKTLDS